MESSMNNKAFFENLMSSISLSYRQKIDRKLVDQYWQFLKGYSQERLTQAFKDAVELEEYFPSIATLMKYLKGTADREEEEPWPTFKEIPTHSEIAKDSLALISTVWSDEPLTKKQYYEEMLTLHEKYPMTGFDKYAKRYAEKVNLIPF